MTSFVHLFELYASVLSSQSDQANGSSEYEQVTSRIPVLDTLEVSLFQQPFQLETCSCRGTSAP